MMRHHFTHTLIAAILYFLTAMASIYMLNPQSIVNFVGPSAALMSGLLLIWSVTPFIAVLIASPVLALCIRYYYQLDASLAVMTIAVLAITLQGVWTRHLAYRFIHYKKWINSRKHLFFFLLRIGPIGSLVSASAVLVISMLDNQVMQGSFIYTFMSTWSASMLVAVFFIPLLLVIKNREEFIFTKRLFVGGTSLLGGLVIFLLLKTSQYEQQHYRQALFMQSTLEIQRLMLAEIEIIENKINSISAFFKASENVSLTEFNLFSKSIFKQHSSVRAIEWAPIVPFTERKAFETQGTITLQQDYKIKERLANGKITIAQARNRYAPLYYIYPQHGNRVVLGLDVYSNPQQILSMKNVENSNDIIASAPIMLKQDELSSPAMLFSKAVYSMPVTTGVTKNATLKNVPEQKISVIKDKKLLGFVVAVVQLEPFFERLAKQKSLDINLFIQDISNNKQLTLFGQNLAVKNRYTDTINLPVFSRNWQINLAEKKTWFSQEQSWQAWAVLIGGTVGAVLFQMLVLMMAAYSRELALQVNVKTRALIVAKEKSENKSSAKSNFLQVLNTELRVPLQALKSFVEQLKKKGINNKEVTGISHAGSNISLLLDTMMDLSNIESGKITPKTDCFDFYGFLQRMESVIKASNHSASKSTFFLIDESVPPYINSDELYIQKLLHCLIESAHQVLETDMLRLSIKLHTHKAQKSSASLFFTLSSLQPATGGLNTEVFTQQKYKQANSGSTVLAMAIKYSQLLRGDTNLGVLSSGAGVINSSIKVIVSSPEEQEAQQALTFDLLE
ncbi:CHASE domain-containing protein [Colwellia sp. E2M01]|uniref:CHASE domain-containing protein n=1 Tax=Colwellia sp. E2M01 TaxID=2841561 RepID=UPI001C09302A|nr:CHASE domain-containing protein [Colwellia sp. E2M01]MBU2872262.1 CHASE domain-containing protein [Colwellia sp. E2M01]